MDRDAEGQAKGDATGGTTKGRQAWRGNNNGVQHTKRQKAIQTSALLSPNVYVCRFSVYPMQDTVWKNWTPVVTLPRLSNGHVAQYIDIFKKYSGDGTATFLVPFFVHFACDGNCSAQVSSEPIYGPTMINPYTVRPMTGLNGDQMDKVLLYMARQDANIAGLHAKVRLLQRDHVWEMLYLQPKNTLVPPSLRMRLSCPTQWLS